MELKRKAGSAGIGLIGTGSKLKKISLSAFDDDDDIKTSSEPGAAKGIDSENPDSAPINAVSTEQKDIIFKTALWVANNQDKASVLLEKSKSNPTLAFLFDASAATPAGKMYMKEMARLKAEIEVSAVCNDLPITDSSKPITPNVPVTAAQILQHLKQQQQLQQNPQASLQINHPLTFQGISAPSSSSGAEGGGNTEEKPRERRNKWGPPADSVLVPQPSVLAPTSAALIAAAALASASRMHAVQQSTQVGLSSSSQQVPSRGTMTEEQTIAHLAATFDSGSSSDMERIQKLVKEQREMQLIESRIRDAAAQNLSGGGGENGGITEVAAFLAENAKRTNKYRNENNAEESLSTQFNPQLQIAEQQATLYLERLSQYEELAQLDQDGNSSSRRDTIHDAERSGGVIEGGTWEHRKRAKEMMNTAAKNLELTLLGSGKHHMADFLPPEILQNFLRHSDAVRSGTTALLPVAADTTALNNDNLGFQLLRKAGWTEGTGLGANSGGIVNPMHAAGGLMAPSVTGAALINQNMLNGSSSGAAGPNLAAFTANASVGTIHVPGITGGAGPEGSGLGTHATHEVAADDTEFDSYRKRMMLAYRFRPNPLNNPRRNYY